MKQLIFFAEFFQIFLLLSFMSGIFAEDCKQTGKGFAVVELFTSEGCSDCPKADKNLNELSKFETSKNIYPLAFHVTYWDYIGWKDSFGKQEFTDRQEKYNRYLRTGTYTPQAVVNGKLDIIGSKRSSLFSAIESELLNQNTINIELNANRKVNTLEIEYKVNCIKANQVLNIALVEKGLFTSVTRGENRGSKLSHENVVRSFNTTTLTKKTGKIKLEFPDLEKNITNFELISFVQDIDTFIILGASKSKLN
ncbi:MAG: DUF1223 domain-containing protein [Leptospiraceae bacterium]|nr:DUF1223 domain-containing protein [Leptospiraceae bacterium]